MLGRLADLLKQKNESQLQLESHKNGEVTISLESLKDIDRSIKKANSDIKQIENEFKQKYAMYLNFKDTTDLIDTYEHTLSQLNEETPLIQASMQKLQNLMNDYNTLSEEALKGNVNYDAKFYD